MFSILSPILCFGRDVVLVFMAFTACSYLRDMTEYTHELVSVTYHLSEIRRRIHALERYYARKYSKRGRNDSESTEILSEEKKEN